MTDHNYQQLLKKLLLDAEHLDRAQPSPDAAWLREHAALCRKAAFCIKQLLDSQAQFSEGEGGLLRELTADEVLVLHPGTAVYVVHDGKGSWKDTLTEVMAFIDMYDVKLDSGAFLPMEEYGIKWRMYCLDET